MSKREILITSKQIEQLNNQTLAPQFISFLAMLAPKNKFHTLMDVTNVCSYGCDICYKKSGNARMSLSTFKSIVSGVAKHKRFKNHITITGGEPSELYYHYGTHDLRDMIQFVYDQGFEVGLKTNAGWTLKNDAEVMWKDLESVNFMDKDFLLDLSVDVHHRNSFQTSNKVLKRICHSEKLKDKTRLDLLSVGPDSSNLEAIMSADNLSALGLKLKYRIPEDESRRGTHTTSVYERCKINDTNVNLHYNGTIVQVESALKNNIGVPDGTHPLQVINAAGHIVLWYDHSNNVHIGNKHKPYFTTSYLNPDNSLKSVDEIIYELSWLVFEESKQNLIERIRTAEAKQMVAKIQRQHVETFLPFYEYLR